MTRIAVGLIGSLAAMLSACNSGVSVDSAEQARDIAKANATFLATKWRAENKRDDVEIYSRGDSTISRTCPQGDGWASIDILDQKTHAVVEKLKCSTYSMGIGCMTESDFKTKRYAQEDGQCSTEVEFPLKKIVQ